MVKLCLRLQKKISIFRALGIVAIQIRDCSLCYGGFRATAAIKQLLSMWMLKMGLKRLRENKDTSFTTNIIFLANEVVSKQVYLKDTL